MSAREHTSPATVTVNGVRLEAPTLTFREGCDETTEREDGGLHWCTMGAT